MSKNTRLWPISAILMPIITALAYFFFKGGAKGMLSEIKSIDWDVLLVVAPVLVMSIAVLHSSITCKKGSCGLCAGLFWVELISPFAFIGILSMIGILPITTIFIFLTLPIAIACSKTMMNSVSGGKWMLADMVARTAHLQRLFSLLLAAGLACGVLL